MATPFYRWTETDPFGHSIHCGAAEWQHVLTEHYEVGPFKVAVRAALRQPQLIYDDLTATARLVNPRGRVLDYIVGAPQDTRFAGLLLKVSVKWLPDGPDGAIVGYVQTAFFVPRLKGRVQLRWRQPP